MRIRTAVRILLAGFGLYSGVVITVHNYDRIRPWLPKDVRYVEKLVPVEVKVETPPPVWMTKEEVTELIFQMVPEANIDPRLFFVLAGAESGPGWSTTRERFEPH